MRATNVPRTCPPTERSPGSRRAALPSRAVAEEDGQDQRAEQDRHPASPPSAGQRRTPNLKGRLFGETHARVWTIVSGIATVIALVITIFALRSSAGPSASSAPTSSPSQAPSVPSMPTTTSASATGPALTTAPSAPRPTPEVINLYAGQSEDAFDGAVSVALVAINDTGPTDLVTVLLTDNHTGKQQQLAGLTVGSRRTFGRYVLRVTCTRLCTDEVEFEISVT